MSSTHCFAAWAPASAQPFRTSIRTAIWHPHPHNHSVSHLLGRLQAAHVAQVLQALPHHGALESDKHDEGKQGVVPVEGMPTKQHVVKLADGCCFGRHPYRSAEWLCRIWHDALATQQSQGPATRASQPAACIPHQRCAHCSLCHTVRCTGLAVNPGQEHTPVAKSGSPVVIQRPQADAEHLQTLRQARRK